MAEQIGRIRITVTVAGITFYKMYGKYFARQKSSLDGKRVKKDQAFRETMRYANLLAKGFVINSYVYRSLLKEKIRRKLYQQLTRKAMRLLKEGWNREEVILKLKGVVMSYDFRG